MNFLVSSYTETFSMHGYLGFYLGLELVFSLILNFLTVMP